MEVLPNSQTTTPKLVMMNLLKIGNQTFEVQSLNRKDEISCSLIKKSLYRSTGRSALKDSRS